MGPISVVVQDSNNLVLEVSPTPETSIVLDRGIAGPIGLVWKGNWSNATAYVTNDAVYYSAGNASYICILANTNQLPTNTTYWQLLVSGAGNVTGAASSTDNAITRFDGTTGKLIQNSLATISDTGVLTAPDVIATTNPLVQQSDIGTAPNEIPLNQYLGNLAYQDAANIAGPVGVGGALTVNGTTTLTGAATFAANPVMSGGTANGVAYLNGSKVLTTGSALTFDGTNLGIGTSSPAYKLDVNGTINTNTSGFYSGGVNVISSDASSVYLKTGTRLYIQSGSTNLAQLTSDGNLGLGVTPSAWGSNYKAIDVSNGGGGIFGIVGNGTTGMGFNFYNNNTNNIYKFSTFAAKFEVNNAGQFTWFTAPSGTAGNAITFTQAMTLDAAGSLLVNTTSSTVRVDSGGTNAIPRLLSAAASTGTTRTTQPPLLTLLNSSSTLTANRMARLSFAAISSGLSLPIHSADITAIFTSGASGNGVSSDLVFSTCNNTVAQEPAERMRLDSSGNLNVVGSITSKSFTETVFAITDGASVDINPANGTIQTWTLGANRTPTATSFVSGQSITLMIADGTSYSVTWTTIGVVWVNGVVPTLPTSGYAVIVLWKVGSTVYGSYAGAVA